MALALDNLLTMLHISSMEATKSSSELNYQRDERRVQLIVYRLIWCSKRRKSLVVGAVKERYQALLEAKCKEKDWTILRLSLSF